MGSDLPTEAVKELVFGGAFGLCTGIAVRKLSLPALAGLASIAFVFLRAAIFDGRILAPWSPLSIDDSSFASDLGRKSRRKALSDSKRMEMFLKENFMVFTGYSGAFFLGTL